MNVFADQKVNVCHSKQQLKSKVFKDYVKIADLSKNDALLYLDRLEQPKMTKFLYKSVDVADLYRLHMYSGQDIVIPGDWQTFDILFDDWKLSADLKENDVIKTASGKATIYQIEKLPRDMFIDIHTESYRFCINDIYVAIA